MPTRVFLTVVIILASADALAIGVIVVVGCCLFWSGTGGELQAYGTLKPNESKRQHTFTGHVWVDDIWSVGPALRPAFNKRNPREQAELAKALDARRAARD